MTWSRKTIIVELHIGGNDVEFVAQGLTCSGPACCNASFDAYVRMSRAFRCPEPLDVSRCGHMTAPFKAQRSEEVRQGLERGFGSTEEGKRLGKRQRAVEKR